MTYAILFTTAASRQIRKLPRPARDRLLTTVGTLADDPRPPGARKLVGEENAWRVRVGDYRVLYEIADQLLTVTVVRAGHRREVYDR
ncbi:type II toxin-antitoxin system RelE family toxin [Cellulomonas hominis]